MTDDPTSGCCRNFCYMASLCILGAEVMQLLDEIALDVLGATIQMEPGPQSASLEKIGMHSLHPNHIHKPVALAYLSLWLQDAKQQKLCAVLCGNVADGVTSLENFCPSLAFSWGPLVVALWRQCISIHISGKDCNTHEELLLHDEFQHLLADTVRDVGSTCSCDTEHQILESHHEAFAPHILRTLHSPGLHQTVAVRNTYD